MTRLAGGLMLVMAVTAAAAPVPKGAEPAAPYYPTKAGAKWVYEKAGGRGEAVVVEAVEMAGDELVVRRAGADGNPVVYLKTAVSARGVRQIPVRGGDGPAVWLLKTPFKPGDSWDTAEEAGAGKRTVFGPEEVEVGAGKFRAARVVLEFKAGSDPARITFYYAPGVGEVKRVETAADGTETVTRNLKSFTLAKP